MTGKPKIQHWVPRFYLKRFATQASKASRNPKVWVTDKAEPNIAPRLTSTKRICGMRYLNSPEDPQGDRNWAFEDYLTGLETAAADYWDKFCDGDLDLTKSGARTRVAEFIAALHLRNKLMFDLISRTMVLRDALIGGPTLSRRRSHLDPDEEWPDLTHPGRHFVQSSKNLIPKLTSTFAAYRWTMLFFPDELLVTSDVPVTFVNSIHRRGGPGSKDPKAIFPLSPTTLLYMECADEEHDFEKKEADLKLAQDINSSMDHFAERFVISAHMPSDTKESTLG